MTEENRKLLLIDLCARLPYHVRCKIWLKDGTTEKGLLDLEHNYGNVLQDAFYYNKIKDIKPYLRPMSSMTEEEMEELEKITYYTFKYKKGDCEIWTNSYHRVYLFNGAGELYGAGEPTNMLCSSSICIKLIDWLNKHHFDYRGLIKKGLALEAPEGMYNLNK